MRISSMNYLVRQGFRSVWVNRLMSVATIGVLLTSFLLVGAAFLLTQNIDRMIAYTETQNDTTIFIIDETPEEEIKAFIIEVEQTAHVESVRYISPEDTLVNIIKELGEDGWLYEDVPPETFPPAIKFQMDDLRYLDEVIQAFENNEIVLKINSPVQVAEVLVSTRDTINLFALFIILALIIVSLVIINNTIRTTVYVRRTEIEIMRNIGAQKNFIRIPFIIEGVILGAFSAGISYFIIRFIYLRIVNNLDSDQMFLNNIIDQVIPFDKISPALIAIFLTAGIFLGILGSLLSLRRHLKEKE